MPFVFVASFNDKCNCDKFIKSLNKINDTLSPTLPIRGFFEFSPDVRIIFYILDKDYMLFKKIKTEFEGPNRECIMEEYSITEKSAGKEIRSWDKIKGVFKELPRFNIGPNIEDLEKLIEFINENKIFFSSGGVPGVD